MAFNGYLLKIGEDVFPLRFVFKESYRITPNRRQDLGSNRNANGVLVRNVLEHKPTTISFQTRPMDDSMLEQMMSFIRERYVDENEKKVLLEFYCPDTNSYKTGEFYIPDMEFPIMRVDLEKNKVFYNSFTLEFIEY